MGLGNQQTTDKELALSWLAGIIEGEGMLTLCMAERKHSIEVTPRVMIANTDSELVEAIVAADKLYVGGAHVRWRRRNNPKHKPIANVTWDGLKRVNRLLENIIPYMRGSKKKLASLMLEYTKQRLARSHYHSPKDVTLIRSILEECVGGLTPHRQRLLSKLSEISDRAVPNRGHMPEAQAAKIRLAMARGRWVNPTQRRKSLDAKVG